MIGCLWLLVALAAADTSQDQARPFDTIVLNDKADSVPLDLGRLQTPQRPHNYLGESHTSDQSDSEKAVKAALKAKEQKALIRVRSSRARIIPALGGYGLARIRGEEGECSQQRDIPGWFKVSPLGLVSPLGGDLAQMCASRCTQKQGKQQFAVETSGDPQGESEYHKCRCVEGKCDQIITGGAGSHRMRINKYKITSWPTAPTTAFFCEEWDCADGTGERFLINTAWNCASPNKTFPSGKFSTGEECYDAVVGKDPKCTAHYPISFNAKSRECSCCSSLQPSLTTNASWRVLVPNPDFSPGERYLAPCADTTIMAGCKAWAKLGANMQFGCQIYGNGYDNTTNQLGEKGEEAEDDQEFDQQTTATAAVILSPSTDSFNPLWTKPTRNYPSCNMTECHACCDDVFDVMLQAEGCKRGCQMYGQLVAFKQYSGKSHEIPYLAMIAEQSSFSNYTEIHTGNDCGGGSNTMLQNVSLGSTAICQSRCNQIPSCTDIMVAELVDTPEVLCSLFDGCEEQRNTTHWKHYAKGSKKAENAAAKGSNVASRALHTNLRNIPRFTCGSSSSRSSPPSWQGTSLGALMDDNGALEALELFDVAKTQNGRRRKTLEEATGVQNSEAAVRLQKCGAAWSAANGTVESAAETCRQMAGCVGFNVDTLNSNRPCFAVSRTWSGLRVDSPSYIDLSKPDSPGDLSGRWVQCRQQVHQPTCSWTEVQDEPWWKVALTGKWDVTSVTLTNADDQETTTAFPVNISVGRKICAYNVNIGAEETITTPCVGSGSVIKVQSSKSNVALAICGFSATGTNATLKPPPSPPFQEIDSAAHCCKGWHCERNKHIPGSCLSASPLDVVSPQQHANPWCKKMVNLHGTAKMESTGSDADLNGMLPNDTVVNGSELKAFWKSTCSGVGSVNSKECPPDTKRMTTKEECASAAVKNGKRFNREGTFNWLPLGCYENLGNNNYYFNIAQKNGVREFAKPVCIPQQWSTGTKGTSPNGKADDCAGLTTNLTLSECKSLCDATFGCAAIGHDKYGTCYLKRDHSSTEPNDPQDSTQVCWKSRLSTAPGATPQDCEASCQKNSNCTHFSHSTAKQECDFCSKCDLVSSTTFSSWIRGTVVPSLSPTVAPTTPAPSETPTNAPTGVPTRYNDQVHVENIKYEARYINAKRKVTSAKLYAAVDRCMRNDNQRKLQDVQKVLHVMKQSKASANVPRAYQQMKQQILAGVENLVKLAEASNVFGGFSGRATEGDTLLGESMAATAGQDGASVDQSSGYTLGELGQATCAAGYGELSPGECYKAAVSLFNQQDKSPGANRLSPDATLAPLSQMRTGSFTTVPHGCSISVRPTSSKAMVVFFNKHVTEADPLKMTGCDSPSRSSECDYSFKVCVDRGGSYAWPNSFHEAFFGKDCTGYDPNMIPEENARNNACACWDQSTLCADTHRMCASGQCPQRASSKPSFGLSVLDKGTCGPSNRFLDLSGMPLPEGSAAQFPPRIDTSGDPAQECAQRCTDAFAGQQLHAFFVRDSDGKCACSSDTCPIVGQMPVAKPMVPSPMSFTIYNITSWPKKVIPSSKLLGVLKTCVNHAPTKTMYVTSLQACAAHCEGLSQVYIFPNENFWGSNSTSTFCSAQGCKCGCESTAAAGCTMQNHTHWNSYAFTSPQYKPVGQIGSQPIFQGATLETVSYTNLTECDVACRRNAKCKHYNACPVEKRCHLKSGDSKVVDFVNPSGGCQMYFPILQRGWSLLKIGSSPWGAHNVHKLWGIFELNYPGFGLPPRCSKMQLTNASAPQDAPTTKAPTASPTVPKHLQLNISRAEDPEACAAKCSASHDYFMFSSSSLNCSCFKWEKDFCRNTSKSDVYDLYELGTAPTWHAPDGYICTSESKSEYQCIGIPSIEARPASETLDSAAAKCDMDSGNCGGFEFDTETNQPCFQQLLTGNSTASGPLTMQGDLSNKFILCRRKPGTDLSTMRKTCPKTCGVCKNSNYFKGASAAKCSKICAGVPRERVYAAALINASQAARFCEKAFTSSSPGFLGLSKDVVAKQDKGMHVAYYNSPGCIWPLNIHSTDECIKSQSDLWDSTHQAEWKEPAWQVNQQNQASSSAGCMRFQYGSSTIATIRNMEPNTCGDPRYPYLKPGTKACYATSTFALPPATGDCQANYGAKIGDSLPSGVGTVTPATFRICPSSAPRCQRTTAMESQFVGECKSNPEPAAQNGPDCGWCCLGNRIALPTGQSGTWGAGCGETLRAGCELQTCNQSSRWNSIRLGRAADWKRGINLYRGGESNYQNSHCNLLERNCVCPLGWDIEGSVMIGGAICKRAGQSLMRNCENLCTLNIALKPSDPSCASLPRCTSGLVQSIDGPAKIAGAVFDTFSICRKPGVFFPYVCPGGFSSTMEISYGVIEGGVEIETIFMKTSDLCAECVAACKFPCMAVQYSRTSVYDTSDQTFIKNSTKGKCTFFSNYVAYRTTTDWRNIIVTGLTRAPTLSPTMPPTFTHIAIKGASTCDYGEAISESDCLIAAIAAMPAVMKSKRKDPVTLKIHNGSVAPSGCSMYTPYRSSFQASDGLQLWDPQFNRQRFSVNDGNYSLICSDRMSTVQPTPASTIAPTDAPTATYAPSIEPTNDPTTSVPVQAPTDKPTGIQSSVPTSAPSFYPTPTELSPEVLRHHKEMSSRAQIAAHTAELKQTVIHKAIIAMKEKKHLEKQKVAYGLQAIVNDKRSALELEIQKVQYLEKMCSNSSTIPDAELKIALHQVHLPPAAIASALHKVGILRTIRNTLSKLHKLSRLNDAHSMFALKKVGETLLTATKGIETKTKLKLQPTLSLPP